MATEPTGQEILAARIMLLTWGGLRDRNLDVDAIVRRMLVAAKNAEGTQS